MRALITRRIGRVLGGLSLVVGIFWTGRVSTHGVTAFWERWWCPIPLALTLLGIVVLITTSRPPRQVPDAAAD